MMNRRIKKKITKRVLNNIKNDKPLTKFEYRVLMKYLYPTFKETYISVRNAFGIVTNKINKLNVEDAEEPLDISISLDIDAIDALRYSLELKPTDEERFQSATDAINNFGKQMNPEPPAAPVEEPNKWNKLKGKVKGWFGK